MGNLLPIAIIVAGCGLFAIAIVLIILNWKKDKADKDAEVQIALLISRVAMMDNNLMQKDQIIDEQKRRIAVQSKQLDDVQNRLRDLELILFGKNMNAPKEPNIKFPPLLLIGTDQYIQRQDEIALNKSGIEYNRAINATQNSIEQELRRARQAKSPYKYVMFSGHGDKLGWKMSDGTLLDSYWMNQNLSDVEILYLNGCETTTIGDDMVNIVDYVISMGEKVPTKVAQSFAEIFWTTIQQGKSPGEAFTAAQLVEPSVKPYAIIRY